MHSHRPYGKCQYYIGRYENEHFIPERNGQLSWLGSMLAGPETLADDRGRRIFMGWIADARDWEETGWTGVVTLPWHLYPGPDNGLKIAPVEELAVLRYDEVRLGETRLAAGEEITVDALSSNCMEARMTPGGAAGRRVRDQAAVLTGRRRGDHRHLPHRRRRVRDRLLQVQHRHLVAVSARRHPAGRALPAAGGRDARPGHLRGPLGDRDLRGPRPSDGAARLSATRRQPAVQDLHP